MNAASVQQSPKAESDKPGRAFLDSLMSAVCTAEGDDRGTLWLYACCRAYECAREGAYGYVESGVTRALRAWAHKYSLTTECVSHARKLIIEEKLNVHAAMEHDGPASENLTYGQGDRKAYGIRLSHVQPERIQWVWKGRVPLGKLTVCDGDPGQGKSTLTIDLAARISAGREMPDGSPGVLGSVLILSAEDGVADTIVPRLEAAGANLDRVFTIQDVDVSYEDDDGSGYSTRPVELPKDLPEIEQMVREENVIAVFVDPVMAYLPDRSDSNNDKSVRRVLRHLSDFAERLGVAVFAVRHMTKTPGGKAVYRGGGSIGIIGAARSGLMVFPDPDDEDGERRLLAGSKNNIAKLPPTLAFRLIPHGPIGEYSKIKWEGESHYTADDLAAAESESRGARKSAEEYLREALKDGPRKSASVIGELKAELGVSDRTIKTARSNVKVEAYKVGIEWWMRLPDPEDDSRSCSVNENDSTVPSQGGPDKHS
ncbi:MAG TPA: AAA family ATPase [Bryobacteraceae bacterium]